ncbi:MAG: OmpA family protein [Bacteroidales bacterium]|nr:OmpA family protein [Candidatus Colimorpha pelethequi]
MKKILLSVLAICCFALVAPAQTQNKPEKGPRLGVAKDSMDYMVASPFNNWFLSVGGGIQTFIGNELYADARKNKFFNYNLSAEFGKWVLPDLAVSLQASWFDVDGQSNYRGLQPFIENTGDDAYQHFYAHAVSVMGLVTLDWTNLIQGYEKGMHRHLHIMTPVGLGAAMLYGEQKNSSVQALRNHEVGEMRKNFELCYTAALQFEYITRGILAFDLSARLLGSESTFDWSPYDNSYSRFDIMPQVLAGVKFNFVNKGRREKLMNSTAEDRLILNSVFLPSSDIYELKEIDNLASSLFDDNGMLIPGTDGVHMDKEGQLVDKNGNPVPEGVHLDKNGDLVDANGNYLDQYCNPIAEGVHVENGQMVDKNGNPVASGVKKNADGQLTDLNGNPIAGALHMDADGNLVDNNGYVLNNGTHFDDDGYLVDAEGNYLDPNGNLIGSKVHLYNPGYRGQGLSDLQAKLDSVEVANKDLLNHILNVADREELPSLIVYYQLDKYNIDVNARMKIDEFARAIKADGNNKTYYLIGAADSATGSVSRNIFLGKARCKAVYDILVNEYGISADRLKCFPLGGITEFEPKELNRVCIVVEPNDELAKLLEKWSVRE